MNERVELRREIPARFSRGEKFQTIMRGTDPGFKLERSL
jgi:hypothetical protein